MSTLCLKCGYSITEPICASCVINEIKVWLYEQPQKKEISRRINNELRYLLNQVEFLDYVSYPSENPENFLIMKCIKCEKEMHLMCFYCVTNRASQIVKDNLENENSIENFNESFNMEPYDYKLNKEISANVDN